MRYRILTVALKVLLGVTLTGIDTGCDVTNGYAITPGPEWVLERSPAGGFEAVPDATLRSPNPADFVIENQMPTRVTFRFRVGEDEVALGGTLLVDIAVDERDAGTDGEPGQSEAGDPGVDSATVDAGSGGASGAGGAIDGSADTGGSDAAGGSGGTAPVVPASIVDDFSDGNFTSDPEWTLRRVFSTALVNVQAGEWLFAGNATNFGQLFSFTRIATTPTIDFSFDFKLNSLTGMGCFQFFVAAGGFDEGYAGTGCTSYPSGSRGGHIVNIARDRVEVSGFPPLRGRFLGRSTAVPNTFDFEWHRARVTRTRVGRIQISIDGNPVLSAEDGSQPDTDTVGFFVGPGQGGLENIIIDNVRASALAEQPAPGCNGACVVQVSAGGDHTCARKADNTIRCWGGIPPAPSGLFSDISSGTNHACAIASDGAIHCWGSNGDGESSPPAGTFASVASGYQHSCALDAGGSVHCWGLNADGESSPPEGSFNKVVAGIFYTCGLRTDGSVRCWGSNWFGQLDPVPGNYTDLALVIGSVFALRPDGTVARWGSEGHHVENLPEGPFVALSANERSACGLRAGVGAICWGNQGSSEGDYLSISTGFRHSCAVRRPGTVNCWGNDESGQLDVPAGW